MSDLEAQLSMLLEETVGDPPRDIRVADVRRRAGRQRRLLAGGVTGAALLAAVAVLVPVLLAGGAGPSERVVGPSSATVLVTPSQHLRRGQQVRVTVTGFPPGAKVWLSECATAAQANPLGCGDQLAAQPFLATDEHGAGTGGFTVQTFAGVHPYDTRHMAPCGSRCVLVATVGGLPTADNRRVAYTPLDFTPLPPSRRPATSSAAPTAPFTVVRRLPMPDEPQRLIATDGALFVLSYLGSNDGWTLARIDPASGQASVTVRLVDVTDITLGGGLLWVLQARMHDGTPVPATLVALEPAALGTVHMLSLSGEPALDLAYAGGLVWVSRATGLTAVDPATATVRRSVPVPNPDPGALPVRATASADGTALWTTEAAKAGGPVPVQLRDPHSGAVLASSPGAGDSVAGAGITAADDHAWLFYGTGMMGGYTRVDRHGAQLVAMPAQSGEGVATFTNAVTAQLVGDRLWVLDGQSAAVADDRTGQPLARAAFPTNDRAALAPLPDGRYALAQNRAVLVVQPRPIDPQAYTDAVAEVNAFLAAWQRAGLSAAATRYLTPAERPPNGPTPALADGRVIGYGPRTWVSNDQFTLGVTMQLRFPGHDTGSYTNGVNNRLITFDRPRPGAAYLMTIAPGLG